MSERMTEEEMIELLAASAQQFLRSLSARAIVPKLMSAITANGKHVLIPLDQLSIDRGARLQFYCWLCQREKIVAYAYISHVGIAADESGDLIQHAGHIVVHTPNRGRDITMRYVPVRSQGIVYGSPEIFELDQADTQASLFYFFRPPTLSSLEKWKFARVWGRLARISEWRTV